MPKTITWIRNLILQAHSRDSAVNIITPLTLLFCGSVLSWRITMLIAPLFFSTLLRNCEWMVLKGCDVTDPLYFFRLFFFFFLFFRRHWIGWKDFENVILDPWFETKLKYGFLSRDISSDLLSKLPFLLSFLKGRELGGWKRRIYPFLCYCGLKNESGIRVWNVCRTLSKYRLAPPPPW